MPENIEIIIAAVDKTQAASAAATANLERVHAQMEAINQKNLASISTGRTLGESFARSARAAQTAASQIRGLRSEFDALRNSHISYNDMVRRYGEFAGGAAFVRQQAASRAVILAQTERTLAAHEEQQERRGSLEYLRAAIPVAPPLPIAPRREKDESDKDFMRRHAEFERDYAAAVKSQNASLRETYSATLAAQTAAERNAYRERIANARRGMEELSRVEKERFQFQERTAPSQSVAEHRKMLDQQLALIDNYYQKRKNIQHQVLAAENSAERAAYRRRMESAHASLNDLGRAEEESFKFRQQMAPALGLSSAVHFEKTVAGLRAVHSETEQGFIAAMNWGQVWRHSVAMIDEALRGQRGQMASTASAMMRDAGVTARALGFLGKMGSYITPGVVGIGAAGVALAYLAYEAMRSQTAINAVRVHFGMLGQSATMTESKISAMRDTLVKTYGESLGSANKLIQAVTHLPAAATGLQQRFLDLGETIGFATGEGSKKATDSLTKMAQGGAESFAKAAIAAYNLDPAILNFVQVAENGADRLKPFEIVLDAIAHRMGDIQKRAREQGTMPNIFGGRIPLGWGPESLAFRAYHAYENYFNPPVPRTPAISPAIRAGTIAVQQAAPELEKRRVLEARINALLASEHQLNLDIGRAKIEGLDTTKKEQQLQDDITAQQNAQIQLEQTLGIAKLNAIQATTAQLETEKLLAKTESERLRIQKEINKEVAAAGGNTPAARAKQQLADTQAEIQARRVSQSIALTHLETERLRSHSVSQRVGILHHEATLLRQNAQTEQDPQRRASLIQQAAAKDRAAYQEDYQHFAAAENAKTQAVRRSLTKTIAEYDYWLSQIKSKYHQDETEFERVQRRKIRAIHESQRAWLQQQETPVQQIAVQTRLARTEIQAHVGFTQAFGTSGETQTAQIQAAQRDAQLVAQSASQQISRYQSIIAQIHSQEQAGYVTRETANQQILQLQNRIDTVHSQALQQQVRDANTAMQAWRAATQDLQTFFNSLSSSFKSATNDIIHALIMPQRTIIHAGLTTIVHSNTGPAIRRAIGNMLVHGVQAAADSVENALGKMLTQSLSSAVGAPAGAGLGGIFSKIFGLGPAIPKPSDFGLTAAATTYQAATAQFAAAVATFSGTTGIKGAVGAPLSLLPSGTLPLDSTASLVRKFESGGNYNIGYGGVDLTNAALNKYGFPIWSGALGPNGMMTHAAGAYQFEPAEWAKYAAPLGIHDFSRASQDAVFRAAYSTEGMKPWASNQKLMTAFNQLESSSTRTASSLNGLTSPLTQFQQDTQLASNVQKLDIATTQAGIGTKTASIGTERALTGAKLLGQSSEITHTASVNADSSALATHAATASTSGAVGAAGGAMGFLGHIPVVGGIISGIASIFSEGGIVPSAQGGMVVPSGALAGGGQISILHPREMVLPARISEGLQHMISNSNSISNMSWPLTYSPNVTVHGNANPTDFTDVLQTHKNDLVGLMRNQVRWGWRPGGGAR